MTPRAALLSLALTAGLLPALVPGLAVPAVAQTAGRAAADTAAPAGGAGQLSISAAINAAERILTTLRAGDAQARYNQFSDDLKRISSPAMVAETLRSQPALKSWSITQVRRGLSSTAVDVEVTTSAGPRQMLLVLTNEGKLAGYHLGRTDQPAAAVVEAFVKALSSGHYISANSFLSPSLARELTPAALQERWQTLQRFTGQFIAFEDAKLAESTPDQKLVLVTTRFNRLTDRLFVILDTDNRIIGIDFPRDAAPEAGVR